MSMSDSLAPVAPEMTLELAKIMCARADAIYHRLHCEVCALQRTKALDFPREQGNATLRDCEKHMRFRLQQINDLRAERADLLVSQAESAEGKALIAHQATLDAIEAEEPSGAVVWFMLNKTQTFLARDQAKLSFNKLITMANQFEDKRNGGSKSERRMYYADHVNITYFTPGRCPIQLEPNEHLTIEHDMYIYIS